MSKWFTIVLALVWLLPAGEGLAAPGKTVVYEGKLQDANRKPIGGIFPLSFALHRNARKGRSLWKEEHFVAIDEGTYEVQLGSKTPIPSGLDVSKLYLSVSVSGGDEIVRERLSTDAVRERTRGAIRAARKGEQAATASRSSSTQRPPGWPMKRSTPRSQTASVIGARPSLRITSRTSAERSASAPPSATPGAQEARAA